ncbi:hypothetical protein PIB30_088791 [Stylosanthes scabra]|uniref:Uncharacterized protein n=1 Tax=Stylosanthes scabra TaxID=79078 RepID=A0ABU6XU22_9FABA|nr:hypothetical protein [Stylosanthes scabra]
MQSCLERPAIRFWGIFFNSFNYAELPMLPMYFFCLQPKVYVVKSELEAAVASIEESIQFLLEECNIYEEELSIVINNKSVVDWLNGSVDTNWTTRHIRNMAINIKHIVLNISVT